MCEGDVIKSSESARNSVLIHQIENLRTLLEKDLTKEQFMKAYIYYKVI